ncbi:unnamed protein product [Linum trigynum]|uniref:Gnk2-homologous domain-containing protein n=1 Tax=Linum trigynum TaxID=586398 RepID=A0AAV2EYW6_9ROSI
MSSSSSSSPRTAVLVVMIMPLIAIHYSTSPAAAQEIKFRCNALSFPLDDHRRVCAYHLLDHLLGWTDPVPVGEFYDTYDCDKGKHTVYGHRKRDDGDAAAACLAKAKDILQKKQCDGRMGGMAWGEGCYMRFEIYPLEDDDDYSD